MPESKASESPPYAFYKYHLQTGPSFQHPMAWQAPCCRSLGDILESKKAHITIIALVILDLVCILIEITISLIQQVDCKDGTSTKSAPFEGSEKHESPTHIAEEVMHWISVTILIIFAIENLLKLMAFGLKYFTKHLMHLFDCFIVIASLALTISLHGVAGELVGLLVLLRFWRIIRLMDSIVLALAWKHEEGIEKMHRVIDDLKKRITELETERETLALVKVEGKGE